MSVGTFPERLWSNEYASCDPENRRSHLLYGDVGFVRCLRQRSAIRRGGDSVDASKVDEKAKVTIKVGLFQPSDTDEYRAGRKQQIAEFNKIYPNITIEPAEIAWGTETFAAGLAGGTLPDVIRISYSDAASITPGKKMADLTDFFKYLDVPGDFSKEALSMVTADGRQYGVPITAYALSLQYNRRLFKEAGLDPDKPPTTWDEVRDYAKKIKEKTGQTGYAHQTMNNTGGWQLIADTASRGYAVEKKNGDKYEADLAGNKGLQEALQFLHDLRWTDDVMGRQFQYFDNIHQDFAAGKIGMYTAVQSNWDEIVGKYKMPEEDYGMGIFPTEGSKANVLGGGEVMVVNKNTDANQRAAAMKWIAYDYFRRYQSQEGATEYAKNLNAQGRAVGLPETPIFEDKLQKQYEEWIKPEINVMQDNYKPFAEGISSVHLTTEPPVAAQEVYAILDSTIQSVLTDEKADINALLDSAQSEAARVVAKAQK